VLVLAGLLVAIGGTAPFPAIAHASPPKADATAATAGSAFHALYPTRIVDTRTGLGAPGGPLGPGTDRSFAAAGSNGIPGTASAIVLNATVTGATAGSFVTLHPTGGAVPTASTINFGAGQTIANSATVKVGAGNQISAFNQTGSVHLVIDVVGWYDDGTGTGELFNGITPTRVLDSRTPVGGWSGPLPAGAANSRTLRISGGGTSIPSTAGTAVLNVTVTGATAPSFLQVWPTGATRPDSSVLNFGAGQTIANLVTTGIGNGGSISFYNVAGATDVVVDVVGYFDPSAGARLHPLAPVRVLDDRVSVGASGPWGPGQVRSVTIAGGNDIPTEATAVVGNLTVANATKGSNLRVFPHLSTESTTSSLNFGPGETIANGLVVGLGVGGAIDIRNNQGFVNVIADVAGWFGPDLQLQQITADSGRWYLPGATTPFVVDPFDGRPAPADFDGNGHWEPANIQSDGSWVTQGTAGTFSFPQPPAVAPYYNGFYPSPVPADYDGDGKAEAAWYRDSDATWFIAGQAPRQFGKGPTSPPTSNNNYYPFGIDEIDQDSPVPADYDGDGKTDLATFRARTGAWTILRSSDGTVSTVTLGDPQQIAFPVPGDYDGVGHAQPAIFDNAAGWQVAGHGAPVSTFGVTGDSYPAPADYAGTGTFQLSYVAHLGTTGPRPWPIQGSATTNDLVGRQWAVPVPFGTNNFASVARYTLIQKCLVNQQFC